ncbi:MAG: threonine/serine exporter family protein [Oscillospiraceae bacterium]|nr:threonine/serine exporter family protein [Oscillospiraceae bacterium]
MRDIIFGDTNSGINRIVQVLLIAVATALGTAVALNCGTWLWGAPADVAVIDHNIVIHCIAAFVACVGFALYFNIHGPDIALCGIGGILAWITYLILCKLGFSDLLGYFCGAIVASAYSEAMARIRKRPAISYLVIGIFPLIPGAGAYYTMNYAVQGHTDLFAAQGMHTIAIASIMALGILLVSSTVRIITVHRKKN